MGEMVPCPFGGEEDSERLDPSVVLNQIIHHPSPPLFLLEIGGLNMSKPSASISHPQLGHF
jgi:hypothetical protein